MTLQRNSENFNGRSSLEVFNMHCLKNSCNDNQDIASFAYGFFLQNSLFIHCNVKMWTSVFALLIIPLQSCFLWRTTSQLANVVKCTFITMHMYWMLQMESEWGQTEQGDIVIFSDQTTVQKGINMYNISMYKKLFYIGMKKKHTSLTNGKNKETIQATV